MYSSSISTKRWSSNRNLLNTGETTLSYFRSLFKDHTRPIIVYQLSSPRRVTFTERIIFLFQRTFRTFPICFTNLSQIFRSVKFFLNFFLKIRDLYLNRCPSQIFYKYMVTFLIYQIYLYFFLDLTFRVSFITCGCQIFYKCKNKYDWNKQNQEIILKIKSFSPPTILRSSISSIVK